MQKNVIEYLEKSVINQPNKTAFFDEKQSITFKEFQIAAKSIATSIINQGVENKSIVVFLPKSIETLVSFIGSAYSHNMYVPVDVSQPIHRIQNIFNVLEPALIITNERYSKYISKINTNAKLLIYTDIINTTIDDNAINHLMSKQISTDPLYTLFTSGSTGIPKGVCVSHQSVIDFVDWVADTFNVSHTDIIANQSPFYFDMSVLDIYSTLKNGSSLFITPEKYFGFPKQILELLSKYNVTTLFWVPSVLINIANSGALNDNYDLKINKCLFAGEVMPNKQLNIWRKKYPNCLYGNLYGPTEIAVICLYYIVDREFNDNESLPIGYPCKNTGILLIKDDNTLVGVNELGEICVRGISLAFGYFNNHEKTEEVFVQNPLNKSYPEKIYKTGDLAYYNERGEVIYSGRKDYQIKHNGYRIELGEIETAVSSLPYIEQCCIIYDNQIVLYYSTREQVDEEIIKKDLLSLIPKYQIPSLYIYKESLPLNPNGKIDRVLLKNELKGEIK